jgi:hypothetical protein
MRPLAVPTWACVLVVAAWLAGTAYAFWAYEFRALGPFERPAAVAQFDAAARAQRAEAWFRAHVAAPPPGTAATVVALESAGCNCNRFSREHVARLATDYAPRRVRVVRADAANAPVDAAPAALVFDAAGRLAYYGPLSVDADCGRSPDGVVEQAVDRVLARRPTTLAPVLATGCYCATRSTAPRA